ncbi:MAG: hypothetical protein EA367_15150 [Leptolyngbya sp. DLM2.Bin15]|uniref:hypothetical protein n=1 Tax=Leptolyngbya sp. CCY15150 TaxID=2767772 RepID=UPI00138030ED|nr:hypothetical protein [Synechococcales cyanobacterium K32_A2020_035]MBF2096273.1 hypothetical protein [Synechococcales cyanobacterium K44_A2020_017]TVQ18330.1 MAG: hypothetical protein EA367_15150 [Leptolyngbya sp. DLM2.Bin15]
MNASEQATNVTVASKIAAVVNLFKSEFPDIRADLKPWMNDEETRELVDPESIDLGFHFPGVSRSAQSRSLLVQIRLGQGSLSTTPRVIGVDVVGFDHRGKQWQLSTIDHWQFVGNTTPAPAVAEKLKRFCCQVFDVFNGSQMAS